MLTKHQIDLAIEATNRLHRRLIEASLAHGTLQVSDTQHRADECLATLVTSMGHALVDLDDAAASFGHNSAARLEGMPSNCRFAETWEAA